MEDYINNTSAEMEEVADLSDDVTSEETEDVAEPLNSEDADTTESNEEHEESTPQVSKKTEQDSAFAEMRRKNKELEDENKLMLDALSRYFNGGNAQELSIQAQAYADDRNPDEVRAEFERTQEAERLKSENEELQEQILNIQLEKRMADDLRTIQGIDPTVKSLEDLGESYLHYISAGLDATDAYYASLLKDQKEKVYPPDAIGKIADTKIDRDYYTSEELDNLTDAELDANWEKVMRSMKRL